MAKSKTRPSVAKPVFDPEAALRFAAEGERAAGKSPAVKLDSKAVSVEIEKASFGYALLTVQIREELLLRARAEASRKGKTLDEFIGKLINKHVGKH